MVYKFLPKILIDDCNVHSILWGYNDTNQTCRTFEDSVNSITMEEVYNKNETVIFIHSFIHSSGIGTKQDTEMVSSEIKDKMKRDITEDPGSGHRIVIASVNLDNKHEICHLC